MTEQQIINKLRSLQRAVCCLKKQESTPEVLSQEGALSGTAPEGYVLGIDTSTGDEYFVNELGEWELLPSGAMLNVESLSNVTDIAAFNDPAIEMLVVENVDRGGSFYKYSGTQVADNGVIFQDASGQKWKRDLSQTDYIDLKWYGVVDGTTFSVPNDIYAKFVAAMTAAYNMENLKSAKVRIPETSAANRFFSCTQTIEITAPITIFGNGQNSYIRWSQDVTAIWMHYTSSNFTTVLKDFRVGGQGIPALTNPGILVNSVLHSENLEVWSFYDGIHFIGSVGSGTNCNNSINYRLRAVNNRRHGVYLNGPDANQITFYHPELVSNGGLGISDQAFLGNMYFVPHWATNGSPTLTYQKGLVRYGGVIYASIRDNNIGIEPTVTANWDEYWYTDSAMQVWTPTYDANIPVWSVGSTYHTVGSYNLNGEEKTPIGSGQNQWGIIIGGYVEGDQAPGYIGARCQAIGGNTDSRGIASDQDSVNGMFWARTGAYLAGPNDTTGISTYIGGESSNYGQGLQLFKSSTEGFFLKYYTGTAFNEGLAKVNPQRGSATSKAVFTNLATTATNLGRDKVTNLIDGNLGVSRMMMLNSSTNHYAIIESVNTRANLPTVTNRDRGDRCFFQKSAYSSEKIESIYAIKEDAISGWSAYANNANDEWLTIKGYAEKVLTSVSGTVNLFVDFNIASGKGILIDVTFVGTSGSDDCVIQRRVLVKNTGGTLSLKNNQEIGTSLKDTAFATTDIDFNLVADDVTIRLINVPSATTGKVNIKRIDY